MTLNPHQKQKVDISGNLDGRLFFANGLFPSMNEEEQKLFRLYGKLPSKKDILKNKLKERKYFDSGDYALSKAGKASDVGVTNIGSQHPLPENIPHHTAAGTPTGSSGNSGSPVKESPLLHAKSPMGSQPPTEGEDAGDAEEASVATTTAEATVGGSAASAVPIPSH